MQLLNEIKVDSIATIKGVTIECCCQYTFQEISVLTSLQATITFSQTLYKI